MSNEKDIFTIQYNHNESSPLSSIDDVSISSESMDDAPFIGNRFSKRKRRNISIFISVIFIIFISRLFFMQVIHGESFESLSENNRFVERIDPAERGVITDRNGEIIAFNTPVFNIMADAYISTLEGEEIDNIIGELTDLIPSLSKEDLYNTLQDEHEREFVLVQEVEKEHALSLMSSLHSIDGLRVTKGSRRSYITDQIPSLSHVIGYTAIINADEYESLDHDYRIIDHIGKSGIEQFYEEMLRGQNGIERFEVNAQGIPQRVINYTESMDGLDMQLSLDIDFQSRIEDILSENLSGSEANRAAVIAMNPNNGEVYALVSWPAFDSNSFTEGISQSEYNSLIENPDNPLFHRAISGELPSGSTIKTIYAAAALEEGIVTPLTTFSSTGGLQVGPRFFPDWRAGGHGITNMYHAIADSVNTYFYIIGGGYDDFAGMGVEKLTDYARLYGLGSKTGIDLPGESEGFLPSKEWKERVKGERWFIGDTYNVSIGQGDVLVTPLQIARATAVFANEGHLVTPILNMSRESEKHQILDEDTAQIIKDGMRRTVTAGSAMSLNTLNVEVAGKTGTAQWSSVKTPHSWFTGFAPYDNPEIVITIITEEGAEQSPATNIAHKIFSAWFDENLNRGTINASATSE